MTGDQHQPTAYWEDAEIQNLLQPIHAPIQRHPQLNTSARARGSSPPHPQITHQRSVQPQSIQRTNIGSLLLGLGLAD